MVKKGINGLALSHTYCMDKKSQTITALTKDKAKQAAKAGVNGGASGCANGCTDKQTAFGVVLSPQDAEEYRLYKRRKRQGEIAAAIAASEGTLMHGEDVQRVCERACRLKQRAVKLPLSKMTQAAYYLSGSRVGLDCVVGGNGETLAKVKAYEVKQAVKRKASEITVPITPSLLDCCRYSEIKRELKRVIRAAGKAAVKVRLEANKLTTPYVRVARIACEVGARFFSVPYFKGCEGFCLELTGGCKLEVTGVETTEDFQRLTAAGVGRIVTHRALEIYTQWVKEADEETLSIFANQTPVAENDSDSSSTQTLENSRGNSAENPPEQPQPTPPTSPTQPEQPVSPTPDGEKPSDEWIVPADPNAPREVNTATPTTVDTAVHNPETEYCCRLEGTQLKFL